MADGDRLVGVIGGMGPEATIDFMSKVLEYTPAGADQDHVRLVVDQNPRTPSRQHALSGDGASPGPVMARAAARLEAAGADFLVMPCNTAHAWQDEIVAAVDIPFISIIDAAVSQALASVADGQAVGLLTTPGCFAAGLYQRAMKDRECELVLQTPDELGDAMRCIDSIKAGDKTAPVADALQALAGRLVDRGAGAIIAACTELPLVLRPSMLEVPLIASTDALAMKTVAVALGREPLP
jgi:aspartate racemase